MSKSTRMTPEQLQAMNLEEYAPGQYRPKRKSDHPITKLQNVFDGNKTARYELYEQGVIPSGTKDHLSMYFKEVPGKEPIMSKVMKEISEQTSRYRKNPLTPDECIKPFDIAAIRALGSGTKKRKQSMDDLHRFAKELVENRGLDSIYIEGNVPSSKNSKEIAKFKKRVNGKLVEMTKLIDSKVTTKYKEEKGNTYALHKHRFLEMIEGKSFPVSVKFTFIRKDIGRFDFGNAQQVVADLMVDHKWIPDDCTEYFVPVFNPVVYYSAQYAGVIIKIL